ncbi:MAG: pseudouridine-5'-phosphate glycosidase [Chloroflexi bacterium]|nr:pseudouridine-5'-phosphate glycosidase [Chloroflexota bacterium]
MNIFLALESTVIAHGLPYPQNLDTARELENVARAHGVEPRTIAVLGGEVKVGLTDAQLEYLAKASNPSAGSGRAVMKLSRRDVAIAIAERRDGATTVAATMWLAHKNGIRVFATGGIGGVHRTVDESQTWDVSADLEELARTPVVVVCAGAKAILDLPATLEYLETHSVPVLGYETDEFPAFYSRSSGLKLQSRVHSPVQAARIIHEHWKMGNLSGVLVCVPIPVSDEIPREEIEPHIKTALREAKEQKIVGSKLTPFLLSWLAGLTANQSIRANVALLKNNVAVASEIAKALAQLESPVA